MMKKLMFAMMLIFAVGTVFAQGVPYAISTIVTPAGVNEVTITNTATGETVVTKTQPDGMLTYDWAPRFVTRGNTFTIRINGETKTIQADPAGPPVILTFTNGVVQQTPTPVPEETPTCPPPAPITEAAAVAFLGGLITAGGYYKISKSKAKKTLNKVTTTKK